MHTSVRTIDTTGRNRGVISLTLLATAFLAAAILSVPVRAQDLDLLIRDGHVIDPRNGLTDVRDVGIAGDTIAVVAPYVSKSRAETVIDATGMYVTPGLIDMHVHVFHGTRPDKYIADSYASVKPDGYTLRAGVTTAVDVGSAGWRNFRTFVKQTVERSETRILAFINIVGVGMEGEPEEQDLGDMNPKLTAMTAGQYEDVIVGVKLAHYRGHEWEPTERAVKAGERAGIPVMVDFGHAEPPLSIEELFMERLRPGDIFTHTYANVSGREAVVEEGELRPFILDAQQRGIVFDVGHGGGSFLFSQGVPGTRQGFWPNSISTDLHTGSMNAGMKNMTNVMSKFLNLGMDLQEVIAKSTWRPAQYIQRPDLGHLSEGAVADVAVLNLKEGNFGFVDVYGTRYDGSQKLEAELTVRAGEVVWDLNGMSAPLWNE
jgi:dihydroorotase